MIRRCEGPGCGQPIPDTARSDRRFHTERCRVRAWQQRTRRDPTPETTKNGPTTTL